MASEKNAPPNGRSDLGLITEESSPEIGPSSHLIEAFEYGLGDTTNDVSDMRRLGKKQEFRVGEPLSSHYVRLAELLLSQRNFGFLATLGFISIYMATWEFVLVYKIKI